VMALRLVGGISDLVPGAEKCATVPSHGDVRPLQLSMPAEPMKTSVRIKERSPTPIQEVFRAEELPESSNPTIAKASGCHNELSDVDIMPAE